jgi:glucose-1-phosphate cytidylyltransferase
MTPRSGPAPGIGLSAGGGRRNWKRGDGRYEPGALGHSHGVFLLSTGAFPRSSQATPLTSPGVLDDQEQFEPSPLRTLILCGGKGTRAYPHSLEVPKPLMAVGDSPILLHLMEIYARQGFTDFVLAAGYRADLIEEFAAQVRVTRRDWRIEVVDGGEETGTGGRISGSTLVTDLGDTFFATYGDGLGAIDLSRLLSFHRSHRGMVTVTAVALPSPYGTLEWNDAGQVKRFIEKPKLMDHWINAGFFVIDNRALDVWHGDDLEREVLPELATKGELFVYQHSGFWKSMDTYKDALELTALCREGEGPWATSPASESS